jgi:hypothetical protein
LVSEKEELVLELSRVSSEFEEMSEIAKRRQDEIDTVRREQRTLEDEIIQTR